jgi:hypothetical protein
MVHAGLDESGSLTADSSHFCMVVVIAPHPLALRHIIHRAAARSGKRLGRPVKDAAEIKWSNASQRIRALALAGLADAHVDSQHNTLVQLADLVAGSVYNWHKSGDRTMQLISGKFGASLEEDWRHIKARWV